MKYLNFIILIIILTSCGGVAELSDNEKKLLDLFQQKDTLVFSNGIDKFDTMYTTPVEYKTQEIRSIERGFYDLATYNVKYELSNRSYHQILNQSKKMSLINFIIRGKDKKISIKEFVFLGLYADGNSENILINETGLIEFEGTPKCYNINECIKSFNFSIEKGVISFIDNNDKQWLRIK